MSFLQGSWRSFETQHICGKNLRNNYTLELYRYERRSALELFIMSVCQHQEKPRDFTVVELVTNLRNKGLLFRTPASAFKTLF